MLGLFISVVRDGLSLVGQEIRKIQAVHGKLTLLSLKGVLDLIFHDQIRQFNRTVFDD